MCGIAGIFSRRAEGVDVAAVKEMGATLRHRGPDDEGLYVDEHIGLAIRRLSIIDVAGGHQPLFNEDGSLVLVFNGEVYNYVELRRQLVARGHAFRTQSDGETILHLYEDEGLEGLLRSLNGMYAFCLWDSRRRLGYVVRDRIGVKPLYYHVSADGDLSFASELKALAASRVPMEIDPRAILSYLSYGYIPGPRTPFVNVWKLPPARYVRFSPDGIDEPRRYWTIPTDSEACADEGRLQQEFLELVESAVALQSRSDVPVGVFLSGGIDSSLISALYTRRAAGRVLAFNVRYAGAAVDEGPYASGIARALGCEHLSIEVGWRDVARDLPRLLWHMDEPHADSALTAIYRVSELASQRVKVILNGTGGDELFGGYPRYRPFPRPVRSWHAVPGPLQSGIINIAGRLAPGVAQKAALNRSPDATYLRALRCFDGTHLQGFFTDRVDLPSESQEMEAVLARAPVAPPTRWMYADASVYLVDDLLLLLDKMTMAASVEGRVPLLDHRLVEWAFRLPGHCKILGRQTKHHLRLWLRDLLPSEILERPKQGFGAPLRQWMDQGMFDTAVRLVSARPPSRATSYWGLRGSALEARMRSFRADQNYALLVLEVWLRVVADGLEPSDVAASLAMAASP